MIILVKKLCMIIPCLVILVLFVILNFINLKKYLEENTEFSWITFESFEEKLKRENNRALQESYDFDETSAAEKQSDVISETVKQTENIDLKLHARASLLLDADTNRVLYEENGYDEMPMASTTKIMTCIVALENGNMDDIVTVSSYAEKMPDVQLNIRKNEQYYLKDLLYPLMLESHNDVAVAIAEHIGGSVEGFATMMNDKARSLGCLNTNFVTPNGLDAAGHYTTARDLAVIASYAIKNGKFVEITNTSSYKFEDISKKRNFTVTNKDRFLYMMEGAIGVKTGFTNGAGYCFVGAVRRLDKTLISVVLGCGWPPKKTLKWMDTKTIMAYGIDNYEKRRINTDTVIGPVPVKDGKKKSEKLMIKDDFYLLMRDGEEVRIDYEMPDYLKAPVEAGVAVGYANCYINEALCAEIPIYTTQEIDKKDFKYCFEQMLQIWGLQ